MILKIGFRNVPLQRIFMNLYIFIENCWIIGILWIWIWWCVKNSVIHDPSSQVRTIRKFIKTDFDVDYSIDIKWSKVTWECPLADWRWSGCKLNDCIFQTSASPSRLALLSEKRGRFIRTKIFNAKLFNCKRKVKWDDIKNEMD